MAKLTKQQILDLYRERIWEIMEKINEEECDLGISLTDPDACIYVSTTAEKVTNIPSSVTLDDENGQPIEIPLKITSDYSPSKLQKQIK